MIKRTCLLHIRLTRLPSSFTYSSHRSNARSPSAHNANGWGFGNHNDNAHNTSQHSGLYVLPAPPVASVTRPDYPVTIDAADLKLLLQKRPEFAEFLYLEIETMKLETERLTHIE